jgi:hypothetical protein
VASIADPTEVTSLVDKLLALLMCVSGLGSLVFGHLVDGAEIAAILVTIAGATGVVGLQVVQAVLKAMAAGLTAAQTVQAQTPAANLAESRPPVVIDR